jgi:hypothetical protein
VLLRQLDPGTLHDGEYAAGVFAGLPEPLSNPALKPRFRALLGDDAKPFECVGEVGECRTAVLLAARRADRTDSLLLQDLAAEVSSRPDAPTDAEMAAMRHPIGETFFPAAYDLGMP